MYSIIPIKIIYTILSSYRYIRARTHHEGIVSSRTLLKLLNPLKCLSSFASSSIGAAKWMCVPSMVLAKALLKYGVGLGG
jgi:hypothetical protein